MESSLQDASPQPREFPLEYLQRITNNFSEDNIIGEGGFGVVYKGVLDNGDVIALKKLTHKGLDDKEFTNEFNNIIRAHHQNIVQFSGYCYHPGTSWVMHNGQYIFAHEPIRILCFEYLHGGNLESHLSDDQPCRPDWQTCYKIIKGVCQGLNYLHNGHIDSIYHLDLKPANILLGNNMIPKIGDFGISRIFPSTKTVTTTTRMMGTMGFMPPEYINKQEISPKYDVFSLGAIIIQIMAGRQTYHDSGSVPSEKTILKVCEKWQKLHPTMSSQTWEEIKTCIGIALRCLEDDRHKRPTIVEIINELNWIDIEALSLTIEATNLSSRDASADNHHNNSASIVIHGSSSRFESSDEPMDYEHESFMRNSECRGIGMPRDLNQTDVGHCTRYPNLRFILL
ncbi:putative receptor-like protein kinase At4g00960 [Triticum dicoccoides]|uniref:putative receptor-like protein kinase At4g00960 n=1 Tax=Triticum dicoccoides TaxID=85692 RepID=UPI0018900F14|nr:putative receptor-like protein kinase At4g00960 [Triticum dicoccoides]